MSAGLEGKRLMEKRQEQKQALGEESILILPPQHFVLLFGHFLCGSVAVLLS